MLDRIADPPDNVVGLVARGRLTAADYEDVLIPAVDAALAEHDKIRLLFGCVLHGEVKAFPPAAAGEARAWVTA